MRKIVDIDVLGDGAFQQLIARLSLVLFACGMVAGILWYVVSAPASAPFGVLTLVVWAALLVVPLAVHELVHALFFKILCPSCHIRFGFKDAFLYTATDNAVLSRSREAVVLLAPTLIVTPATFLVGVSLGCPLGGVMGAVAHLAGCAGDLIMVVEIFSTPGCTHVRDTDVGIELLADGDKDEKNDVGEHEGTRP